MLEFKVTDQTLIRQDNFGVVSDSINYLTAHFDVADSDFGGVITAVFTSLISDVSYELILADNFCVVPWEIIKSRGFKVSLYCDLKNKRITTDCVTVPVKESGFVESQTPQEPSPSVYEQLITAANSAESKAQKVLDMAVRGDFQGEKGEKGDKGDTGTTNYTELEHKPSINSVEIIGDISLADIKAQQALHRGKLKDIVVIKTIEEYDALFADEGYLARMTESMQEDDYILLVIIEVVFSADVPITMFTTLSKKNGELVMDNGFDSTVIDDKISEAVENLRNWTKEKFESEKPVIYTEAEISFVLGHNTEYRKNSICTDLQLRLPSNVPVNYISSLVFNSGNKPTTLSYPQTILFTGDDVIDNVFVPAANTTYNVMFWYDGINVNAVSRGVPYAQE